MSDKSLGDEIDAIIDKYKGEDKVEVFKRKIECDACWDNGWIDVRDPVFGYVRRVPCHYCENLKESLNGIEMTTVVIDDPIVFD